MPSSNLWDNIIQFVGITPENAQQVEAFASILGALIALGGVAFIIYQIAMAKRSLQQASRANLDITRLEHNWKLFERKVDPGLPGLPSLSDPTNEEYWKWRMTHLDHLNLLNTQFIDYESKAISKKEIDGWIGWSKLLLKGFRCDHRKAIEQWRLGNPGKEPATKDIMNFKETSPRLRALLDISELHNWDQFPDDFVKWLLKDCNFISLGLSSKRCLNQMR